MREKRALILDDFHTARDGGMTLAELQVGFPKVNTVTVTVPGLDGILDYTEAVSGRPTYGTRSVTAKLECSHGTRQERQRVFDEFAAKFHGQRVTLRLPEEEQKYLIGRVNISSMVNLIPYGWIELAVACEPWRYSDPPCICKLPIATPTENAIFGIEAILLTSEMNEVSAILAPGTAATFPSVSVIGPRGCAAIWELPLSPNTDYVASGRITEGRGSWTLGTSPAFADGKRGLIRTGTDGKLYLRVEKHSDISLRIAPLFITPAEKLSLLQVGKAPAMATAFSDGVGSHSVAFITGEHANVFSLGTRKQFPLPNGSCPAICYALTSDITASIGWIRGDI